MISEKDEDFLTAWVIHFSLTGCTASVFREKLKNPSNIHFWESTTRVESNQFDFIYFLTQLFLTKDIETLQRIILEPEEIHELVRQSASVRKTFNGSFGEFDEASCIKATDRLPGIRCSFTDEKFVELLVTDLLDPDNNLRGLLRDLAISPRTVFRNDTQERRDSSCVTSHNTRDEEVSPFSQGFMESRTKGSKKVDVIDLEKDIISSQLPPKSQRFNNNVEKPSSQITPKKSRKRRHSPCGRKSFYGKIPRMRTIDTYFKPVPKVKEIKCKDTKENKRSHSNKFEVIIVEDDDYESSNELIGNVFLRDHMWRETNYSVIDELHSLETDCFQEDNISLTGKARASIAKPTEREESDSDICVTCGDLQDSHAKQVMESSALNAEKIVDNFTLSSPVNCSESFHNHTSANTDANNNIDSHSYDQSGTFKLDAVTRELIRDWCGGDTFLTQRSSSGSQEVMEQDDMNTDNDDNSNDDNDYDNNFNKHVNKNNKTDEKDNDNDSDNDSVIITDANNHKRYGDKSESDTDNDISDENSDEDDTDDSDNEIESDDDDDEDYVYNSGNESVSDND